MIIFYGRVGWMESYSGLAGDSITGGGSYNIDNVGFEVHNFLGYEGKYYGFVEPGVGSSIHIERLGGDRKSEYVDDVLMVWVAKKPSGGQYIVGWYKNARVYRNLQSVPSTVMQGRDLQDHNQYNIYSQEAYLLTVEEREFSISNFGQKNIWYGNESIDAAVIEYIESYNNSYDHRISVIDTITAELDGEERESVVKIRINQDKFRSKLQRKYKKCCLCGVTNEKLLIASHIKPWSKSDAKEKLDVNNGLLLCPNHDKLFDSGLISFDDNGRIIISESLTQENRMFTNVFDDMKIVVSSENVQYIQYHRKFVFK